MAMAATASVDLQTASADLRTLAEDEHEPTQVRQGHNWAAPYRRYAVILAAGMVLFIGVGSTNTFGVFQEHYSDSLLRNEPPEKVILIGSCAASMYMILGAFTGRFADLVGYRPSLLIGTALMVGANFAASASTTYVQLLFSQGIMFGLGLAFAYLPAVSISRQYWKQNHGVANGIVVSGGALGGTVLPYIVRKLLDSQGLSQTFKILGYISLGGLAPSIVLLRPIKATTPIWKWRAMDPRTPLFDFSLLRSREFNALLIACTVAMVGFLPRYFLIPESAVSQGISQTYASWLLGLMNGLSIIGRIGIGWIADRYGKVSALNLSFVLCGLGHFIFWLPGVAVSGRQDSMATALFTSFVVYIGLFGSGFISLFPVVIAHLFGDDALASKQGLLNTVVGCGVLAGPSGVYAIVGSGNAQRWPAGVICAGVFMLAGGILLWLLLSRPVKLIRWLGEESV